MSDCCDMKKRMFGKGILVVVLHFPENLLHPDGYVQVHFHILNYLSKVFCNWKGWDVQCVFFRYRGH